MSNEEDATSFMRELGRQEEPIVIVRKRMSDAPSTLSMSDGVTRSTVDTRDLKALLDHDVDQENQLRAWQMAANLDKAEINRRAFDKAEEIVKRRMEVAGESDKYELMQRLRHERAMNWALAQAVSVAVELLANAEDPKTNEALSLLRGALRKVEDREAVGDEAVEYLTASQVADLIPGMTTSRLSQLRFRGTGPTFLKPTPKTVLYRRQDVIDWIEGSEKTKTGGAE